MLPGLRHPPGRDHRRVSGVLEAMLYPQGDHRGNLAQIQIAEGIHRRDPVPGVRRRNRQRPDGDARDQNLGMLGISHWLDPQPAPRRGRRNDDQMVEHGAAGLPYSQAVDQRALGPSGQTVGNESSPLGSLFGLCGEAGESRTGPTSAKPLSGAPDLISSSPALRPERRISAAEGAERRSWRTALMAPST